MALNEGRGAYPGDTHHAKGPQTLNEAGALTPALRGSSVQCHGTLNEGRGAYPGDTANSAKRGNRGETRAILGGGGLGDGMFLGNLHALGSIRVGETGASGKKLALTTLAPTWLHRITEGSQWVKAPKALPVRGVGFDRSAAWRLPSDQGSDTRLRNRDDCR